MERPKPNETEEDILKQEEEFKAKIRESGKSYPAAKVVRIGKRKPDSDSTNASSITSSGKGPENVSENSKPKSRFSESRMKKKKEGITDNTVLKEADSKQNEKTAVLKPIVARDVPTVSSLMAHWKPTPSPHGFPQPPTLPVKDLTGARKESRDSNKEVSRGKSLYMQYMEHEWRKDSSLEMQEKDVKRKDVNLNDEYLSLLGDKSYILDGSSALGQSDEAKKIHEENMSKLSSLSHEERLREREEILSRLSDDQVNFILSLRKKREGEGRIVENSPVVADGGGAERMEVEVDAGKTPSEKINGEEMEEELEPVDLGELPIPPKEAKKWAHMDKIEMEKLKWMTNMPEPKPLKGKEGYVARFSFQGDLLPYDADISWREGLHHHGEEPGRAGYSVDELFVFVRSQVVQQRHLGLKTLANILRNANEGLYDTCFQVPIIQLMVDAGLVLLLRFAMDENTALVYQQALRAMYYLVSSEPDERCLAISDPWSPLGVHPGFSSVTHSKEKDREELDAEEKELKDIEVIKLDVIRALVRMDVHVRLRYFVESETMSPTDVVHVLGILRRIARHSLTAAWTIVQTPRLIESIVKHFLPHNTSQLLSGNNILQLTSVYGVPLSHALSFMKVLASRGRQIAVTLIEKYNLMDRILTYVSVEPTEIEMPLGEVLSLSQEAYCLWSIFLSYNLMKAQNAFVTFYPLFVRQLIFYRDKVDINDKVESNRFNYEIGCHTINVLTKGLSVAATESLLTNRMKNKEPSATSSEGKEVVLQPPVIAWSDFKEILTLVEFCFMKWITQAVRSSSEISFSGFKLLGSICNFLVIYFDKWRDQRDFSGVSFVKKMEGFLENILGVLLTQKNIDLLLKNIRQHSALCSGLQLGKTRDPFNLGSLWSVCGGGKVTPILQKNSTFPFFFPLITLVKTVYTRCPSLCTQPVHTLLNNVNLKNYLSDICEQEHSLLASVAGCDDFLLYHRTALTILPLVHKGDEHVVKRLLVDVICNADFTQDIQQIETQVDELSVKDFKTLKSPAINKLIVSYPEMKKKVLEALPSIGENMVLNLLHSKHLERSSVRYNCVPFLMNDLSIDKEDESLILDYYWSLMPLSLLQMLNESSKGKESDLTQPGTFVSAVKWLQMTFLIVKYRKSVTKLRTNPMGWFRHLSNVFLASNDLFLDSNISTFTQANLTAVLEDGGYKSLDPLWTHHSLQPSYEWYKRLCEHFGSVSYGDSTFAFFVIVPLLRNWPSDFKKVLFGDFYETVVFIRLTSEEISQFIPLEEFLCPPEEDSEVISKYRMVLGSRLLHVKRNPFLHEFVVHHIKRFLEGKNVQR